MRYICSSHTNNSELFKMESEMPFKCNICPKTYEREKQLQMHSYKHGEKPYSCDNCSKTFSTMKGWAGHKETKVCSSPIPCSICGKEFASTSSSSQHSKTHMQVISYQCTVCFKTFLTTESLAIHESLHTSSKPQVCSLCPATFMRKQGLKNHIDRVHEKKEMPLKECNICGEQVGKLKEHLKKHIGNGTEFPCIECGKKWALM